MRDKTELEKSLDSFYMACNRMERKITESNCNFVVSAAKDVVRQLYRIQGKGTDGK